MLVFERADVGVPLGPMLVFLTNIPTARVSILHHHANVHLIYHPLRGVLAGEEHRQGRIQLRVLASKEHQQSRRNLRSSAQSAGHFSCSTVDGGLSLLQRTWREPEFALESGGEVRQILITGKQRNVLNSHLCFLEQHPRFL